MVSDPLGDMLTRIRNGQMARLLYVKSPASTLRVRVLEVLQKEGYIKSFKQDQVRTGIAELTIELGYNNGSPIIKNLERVSTPGRRIYSSIDNLKKFYNGLGVTILSTSKGVMSDYEARVAKVGGEVLCKVF